MPQDWDQTRRHGSCVLLPPWYFFRQIVVDLQIRADNVAWVHAAPYRNVISLKLSFRSIYDEILASLDAIVRTETSPCFQIWILQILLSAENFTLLNGTSISRFYGYAPPNRCSRVNGFCINVFVFITHAISLEPILLFVNRFSFYIFYFKQHKRVMFFLFVHSFSNLSRMSKNIEMDQFSIFIKTKVNMYF